MTSTCPMGFQLTVLLVLFISFPLLVKPCPLVVEPRDLVTLLCHRDLVLKLSDCLSVRVRACQAEPGAGSDVSVPDPTNRGDRELRSSCASADLSVIAVCADHSDLRSKQIAFHEVS
jgi:hypothetical protein